MKEAVIVANARTAVGRAYKGSLKNTRPDDLMATCLKACIERSGIKAEDLDDVIVGCATPEKDQGMNLGRIALLKAGFPVQVPGMTVNRFCSSGLQSIALAADRIMAGGADAILAGGVECMSMSNLLTARMYPNPELMATAPETYMAMGLTAEAVAQKYNISREDADAFAVESHRKALAALESGAFEDEIVDFEVFSKSLGKDAKVQEKSLSFKQDEGPRPETTVEALAKLRPAFSPRGMSTAGNSSQVSDGAAAVLVCSREYAEANGLEIQAVYKGFQLAGVPPEIMGIGPVAAIPKVLKQTGLSLDDMKVIELNEAFAAQSLAVINELGLDQSKVNPLGGAIALGHPLGCTGAKLTVTALNETKRQGGGYFMVTMCIGGGMGAAGIFEVP